MRPLLLVLTTIIAAASSICAQRPSNVTRGVYVHSRNLMGIHVWSDCDSGFEFATDRLHSGETCLKVANEPGAQGAGARHSVTINQEEAAPLKIAGWSRAEDVQADEPSGQYSIDVDLRHTGGEPLYTQIAAFERGTHDRQAQAWDKVGYETDIDFPTTAPYILLHNYLGDPPSRKRWSCDLLQNETRAGGDSRARGEEKPVNEQEMGPPPTRERGLKPLTHL